MPEERVLLASDASEIGDGADITFGDFPAHATLGVEKTFHVSFSAHRTGIPHARVGDDDPLAAFLCTNDIARLQRIMQEVVSSPTLLCRLLALQHRCPRVAREWELPSAADCPALHEYLPDGYGGADFNLFFPISGVEKSIRNMLCRWTRASFRERLVLLSTTTMPWPISACQFRNSMAIVCYNSLHVVIIVSMDTTILNLVPW